MCKVQFYKLDNDIWNSYHLHVIGCFHADCGVELGSLEQPLRITTNNF